MKRITVAASSAYEVCIGNGALQLLGQQTAGLRDCRRAAVISDGNVWPLYGSTAAQSLRSAGIECVYYVIEPGENSKNFENYLKILNFLAENQLTRSDCVIALGGGVVGDLAGFAAATYLRGIALIQVPTSLLAMVDSSVGGKTGIDLPAGKNLCGAFYQPRLVLCDTDLLQTLPEGALRDGCAEVIKYGILFDPTLFSQLEESGLAFERETVIARCIELKRDTVVRDELERGQRKLLNFGHTLAHAIEKCSGFTVSHGQAVAMGMATVSRACGCVDAQRIEACLAHFGLPTAAPFSAKELAAAALADKKRTGACIQLVLCQKLGHCRIQTLALDRLESFIKEGL